MLKRKIQSRQFLNHSNFCARSVKMNSSFMVWLTSSPSCRMQGGYISVKHNSVVYIVHGLGRKIWCLHGRVLQCFDEESKNQASPMLI